MKRYILFVIPIVLTLLVSVTTGGLAFAKSSDEGNSGGASCDPVTGNALQSKCGGIM